MVTATTIEVLVLLVGAGIWYGSNMETGDGQTWPAYCIL